MILLVCLTVQTFLQLQAYISSWNIKPGIDVLVCIIAVSRHCCAMRPSRKLLVISILLTVNYGRINAAANNDTIWKGFSVTCINEERSEVTNASVSCHGIRLVRRIVQKLLEETKRKRSFEFLEGLSLVDRKDKEVSIRGGRVLKGFGQMGHIVEFLENKELRIKLPTLLPKNLEAAIEESLPSIDQARGHGGGGFGGGGGGKKGDNGVMMMGLMMGKMMAAMGFGALGLLAMKALMVSALALMLSLIVAAKKLAGGKDEGGHHIVYAQEVGSHHHRRRRSLESLRDDFLNQPYRGHMIVPTEIR